MTRTLMLLSLLAASLYFPTPTVARELSFAERVEAQETIERQYYMHTVDATRPFEEAVSREALEANVRRYLRESAALERFWGMPVTAEMLDAETQRIAASTMLPDRLQQLYDALGNDPVVIQECLVRPALVRRLLGNFYDGDPGMHRDTRSVADALRAGLVEGTADAEASPAAVSILEITLTDEHDESEATSRTTPEHRTLQVSEQEFARLQAASPGTVGEIGPVLEERERFVFRKLIDRDARTIRLLSYAVPKRSLDSWWIEVEDGLDHRAVSSAAADSGSLPDPVGCFTAFTWDAGVFDDALPARYSHVSVWTGTLMLVWGGVPDEGPATTGYSYDPLTDIWDRMPPSPLALEAGQSRAVWTGAEMLVWGGPDVAGLRYDPLADSWTTMASLDAPAARLFYSATWSGTEMIVWGGVSSTEGLLDSGARYDPVADDWTAMSTIAAPSPRQEHTAVWTGDELVVWGGIDTAVLSTGANYDPVSDTWSAVSDVAAPEGRFKHRSVWTGTEMLVWGGGKFKGPAPEMFDSGGRYDPVSNTWSATSLTSPALARWDHTALWTGTEMIVWGGADEMGPVNGGGRYAPSTDSWQPAGSPDLDPVSRLSHTAIWTGDVMIVWGGALPLPFINLRSGGRYDPVTDLWTPTSLGLGPTPRVGHSSVWTGNELIVWGGGPSNSGGRYDPTLDTWRRTTTTGAPSARSGHVAALVGGELVVWGGSGTDTGGRYDPVTDSWQPTSMVGAPSVRTGATAVTTGAELIVWGGRDGGTFLGDGARYDPVLDAWSPTATSDAPTGRTSHTAIWTGTEMIVWGGQGPGSLDSGGAYYPAADAWLPTTTSGATDARRGHTAVWSGEEMIVWGGICDFGVCTTGGRYDPVVDTWTSIDGSGVFARQNHTAVWTGSRMIVWGGSADCCTEQNTGGTYDPDEDEFTPTTVTNAPASRSGHTATWVDGFMIVWGGQANPGEPLGDGSRLSVDNDHEGSADRCDSCTDIDQDGFGDPGFPLNTCTTDNCPSVPNSMQLDGDLDGYGDACDPCLDDPGPDPDVDGCSALDNCPAVFNPGQTDRDSDAVGDACDSCPVGQPVFGQMIQASGPSSIVWGFALDVEFVRGELTSVSTYGVFDSGTLVGATSLDISADDVPGGSYYLLRANDACASWQTAFGAEPDRDVDLP